MEQWIKRSLAIPAARVRFQPLPNPNEVFSSHVCSGWKDQVMLNCSFQFVEKKCHLWSVLERGIKANQEKRNDCRRLGKGWLSKYLYLILKVLPAKTWRTLDQSSAKTVSFKIDSSERVNVFKRWRRKLVVLVFLRFLNPSKFLKLRRKKKIGKIQTKRRLLLLLRYLSNHYP